MKQAIKDDIQSRTDVSFLVNSFYNKVKADQLLGPIFMKMIPVDKWNDHLIRLSDFWETALFGVVKFKGNPAAAHRKVDQAHNHEIEQEHFGRWLHLWFSTIDEHFEGDKANRAKNGARGMATGQYLAIWNSREENQ